MILLLDAHALLWWLDDSPELGAQAREAISDTANEVLVSAVTVWEIEIKRSLGKLDAPMGLVDAADAAGFGSLTVTLRDAEMAGSLPAHHRDPFDRMLVAQATRLDAILVTRDEVFSRYGVESLST